MAKTIHNSDNNHNTERPIARWRTCTVRSIPRPMMIRPAAVVQAASVKCSMILLSSLVLFTWSCLGVVTSTVAADNATTTTAAADDEIQPEPSTALPVSDNNHHHQQWDDTFIPSPSPSSASTLSIATSSSLYRYMLTLYRRKKEEHWSDWCYDFPTCYTYVGWHTVYSLEQHDLYAYGHRLMLPPKDLPSLCGSFQPVQQEYAQYESDYRSDQEGGDMPPVSLFLTPPAASSTTNCTLKRMQRTMNKLNNLTESVYESIYFFLMPWSEKFINADSASHLPRKIDGYNVYQKTYDVPVLFLGTESAAPAIQSLFRNTSTGANPYYLGTYDSEWDYFFHLQPDYDPFGNSTGCDEDGNCCTRPSDGVCCDFLAMCDYYPSWEDDDSKASSLTLIYVGGAVALVALMIYVSVRKGPATASPQQQQQNPPATTPPEPEVQQPRLTEEDFERLPMIHYQSHLSYRGRKLNSIIDSSAGDSALVESLVSKEFDRSLDDPKSHQVCLVDNVQMEQPRDANSSSAVSTEPPTSESGNNSESTGTELASNDQVQEQPRTTTSGRSGFVTSPSGVGTTTNNNEVCSICVEEFQQNELVRVLPRCQHLYHTQCIREWLLERNRNSCPVCKVTVKEIIDEN